jgi:hypothetical protein
MEGALYCPLRRTWIHLAVVDAVHQHRDTQRIAHQHELVTLRRFVAPLRQLDEEVHGLLPLLATNPSSPCQRHSECICTAKVPTWFVGSTSFTNRWRLRISASATDRLRLSAGRALMVAMTAASEVSSENPLPPCRLLHVAVDACVLSQTEAD